jgi:PAS domain-containing protein
VKIDGDFRQSRRTGVAGRSMELRSPRRNVFPKRLKGELPPQQDNEPEAVPAVPAEGEGGDQLREILESIEGVAYVWDVAEARYSYVSPQAEHIVGYPSSDLIRPGFWLSRVHPADRVRFEHLQRRPAARRRGAFGPS